MPNDSAGGVEVDVSGGSKIGYDEISVLSIATEESITANAH